MIFGRRLSSLKEMYLNYIQRGCRSRFESRNISERERERERERSII